MPVAGSDFPGGHRPLAGFLRAAQLPASVGVDPAPFVCTGDAVTVEALEAVEEVEAIEEDEFCRWAVLRGPGENILLTSSEFIAPKPLPLEVHPIRVLGWKVRGGATAVIEVLAWRVVMRPFLARETPFRLLFARPHLTNYHTLV